MILRETLENLMDFTYRVPKTNVGCRAYLNSAQNNIASGSSTLVNLDVENYDDGSDFSTVTHLFTAPVAGRYLIIGQIGWADQVANWYGIRIFANGTGGTELARYFGKYVSSTTGHVAITTEENLSQGDTIGIYAYTNDGAGSADLVTGRNQTFMCIRLVRKD